MSFQKALARAALIALLPIAASAATMSMPGGTEINATLDNALDTGTAQVGDGFTAHVQPPYPFGNEALAGAVISGEVVQVQRAGQGTKPGIAVQFTTIRLTDGSTAPINGYLAAAQQKSNLKSGARVAAYTIGGMLGGNAIAKTVFGSRAGGWLGALGGFLVGANYQANIQVPQGSAMVIKLRNTLLIRRQARY